jgi:mRNA-degrading endonuclease RelE of RelBE toxin-antitoxin system
MYSFVETRLFTRIVGGYLSDTEYARVQEALSFNPDAGLVIPGSGGVRKLRWAQPGRGKRGGVRIIYYLKRRDGVIWMLTIYAKNEASDIAPADLRRIKDEIDGHDQT